MAAIGGVKALYSAQAQFKKDFNALLVPVVDRASAWLQSASSPDGSIDPRQIETLTAQIGTQVQRVFVADNLRSSYRDVDVPLAEYPALLNKWYVYAVINVVDSHRRYMRRMLRNEPEILAWLENAEQPVAEVYNPTIDPLRSWVSMHRWNDPRG